VRRRQRDEGGERKAYHETGRKDGCTHFLPFLPSGQTPDTPPSRRGVTYGTAGGTPALPRSR
jgi:hypothetical protein